MGWMVFKVLLAWTVLSVLVGTVAGKVFKAHRERPEPVVPPVRLAPVGRRDYRGRKANREPWAVSRDHPDQPDLPENLDLWVSQGLPDPQDR